MIYAKMELCTMICALLGEMINDWIFYKYKQPVASSNFTSNHIYSMILSKFLAILVQTCSIFELQFEATLRKLQPLKTIIISSIICHAYCFNSEVSSIHFNNQLQSLLLINPLKFMFNCWPIYVIADNQSYVNCTRICFQLLFIWIVRQIICYFLDFIAFANFKDRWIKFILACSSN